MASFFLDNTASEVPDIVEPVEIVNKRLGNLHLVFLSCSFCLWLGCCLIINILFRKSVAIEQLNDNIWTYGLFSSR